MRADSKTFKGLLVSLVLLTSQTAFAAATPQPQPISSIDLNQDLLDSISLALPEGNAANAAYLDPSYDPTIRLTDDAQISITFIDEGAGYRNSLGYFTFTDTAFDGLTFSDIDTNSSGNIDYDELLNLDGVTDSGLIFTNASATGKGGNFNAGDTLVLGGGTATQDANGDLQLSGGTIFDAGTNMGFFLVQDGWTGNHVKGIGDNSNPLMIFSTDLLNPENSADATIDNTAAAARHTAMMFANDPGDGLIIGFEDLHRTDSTQNSRGYRSDEDFNDLIFVVNASPYTALGGTDVPDVGNVINAAPAGVVGSSTGLATLAALCMFLRRYRNHH